MTYSATKFEVATSNRLGGYIYKKCDERTAALTHRGTDRQTTDRLWYEIYIPFFPKEKKGIIIKTFRPETNPNGLEIHRVTVLF